MYYNWDFLYSHCRIKDKNKHKKLKRAPPKCQKNSILRVLQRTWASFKSCFGLLQYKMSFILTLCVGFSRLMWTFLQSTPRLFSFLYSFLSKQNKGDFLYFLFSKRTEEASIKQWTTLSSVANRGYVTWTTEATRKMLVLRSTYLTW